MKCINCGKKPAELENLCIDCFLQISPIIKNIKPVKLKKCVKCSSLYEGNHKIEDNEQLEKAILKHISFDKRYKIIKHNLSLEEGDKQFLVNLKIFAKVNGKEIKDDWQIELDVEKFVCPLCSKKASKYFEGILQVLTFNEDVINYIEKLLEKENIPVSNKKQTKKGFEYYLIDKNKLKSIGNKLVEQFGGFVKESASLHTRDRQTSKDVYRLNLAYKPLKIKKGDVFFYNDTIYKMLTPGKTNKVLDLFTLKETRIKNDKYIKIPKIKARVVSKRPLKVLDEEYQLIAVKNPLGKNVKLNSKVNIIEFDGEYFIVD
ncbi:MAG: ribosomal export protein [Candidatus Woesearchaeota archaeon]|nr:ribosomal export protein [Candidatus Woesearchaeota archaeon]